MELLITAVAVGAVATALLVLRFKRSTRLRRLQDQLTGWRRSGRYWGVRVAAEGKGRGCEASRRLSGHVFPIGSAPGLPLPACERKRCNCRYLPYPERRQSDQRRTDRRDAVRFEGSKPERRTADDRRIAIRAWKQERY